MPTFCRHNRFQHNCPICREPVVPASERRTPRRPAPTSARPAAKAGTTGASRSSGARTRGGGGGVRVRRVARAAEDGYANPLVPGLRASADAARLADELAFSADRLAELALAPPGLYAEAAGAPDREEALWLAVLVALLGPLDGEDPFAGVRAARVPWAGGEVPSLAGVALGPRAGVASALEGERALAAYRAWAARAGSQEAALHGEGAWTPERRFDRAYERLGTLPGFARPARYDLLVTLGRLGLADVRPAALHLDDRDAASLAARRAFGIADRFLLERRAADLAAATGVPLEALDLALANWGEGRRATSGASADVLDAAARERAAAALGVAAPAE